MELAPILQSVAPPEDLCAPEVSMCLAGDEVEGQAVGNSMRERSFDAS